MAPLHCENENEVSTSCPKTVLCIDGDSTVLAWRQLLLSIAGYEVRTATNGNSAIELFGSHPIDLVVIGSSFPDQSWLLLAGKIKRLDLKVPIVILNTGCEKLPKGIDGDVIFRSGATAAHFLATLAKLMTNPLPRVDEFTEGTSGDDGQSWMAKAVGKARDSFSPSTHELAMVAACPSIPTMHSFEKRE